jgi:hypothetical protein
MCDLTKGRLEPCKDSNGGLRAIYFINYDSGLYINAGFSEEEIIELISPVDCYKYELKGANSFDESNENSRENGTSFWAGTGTFVFKKQDLATQKELKLLSFGRPQIIIEDYNGNFRLAGLRNGCECVVNTASGAAMGDLNGYNITATSQEASMASFIDATIMDEVDGFVVTEGT